VEVIYKEEKLKELVGGYRMFGEKIAFVPTMGYLHAGHLSLVKLAKEKGTKTVVSIFVNPTQFNDPNDFDQYPVDLERDLKMLEEAGVDVVFTPQKETIYGYDFESWVDLEKITKSLEGAKRPGHFKGVTTVVTILFHMVQPHFAVFGEKDFQQLRTIETLVRDLHMDVAIVRGPTVRESDGLAMSSRNARLSPEARELAPKLQQALKAMKDAFRKGEMETAKLTKIGMTALEHEKINLEYLEIVDEVDLKAAWVAAPANRVLVAATIDGIRLIDNVSI
jgi:pantoate--beta-alanine ligase